MSLPTSGVSLPVPLPSELNEGCLRRDGHLVTWGSIGQGGVVPPLSQCPGCLIWKQSHEYMAFRLPEMLAGVLQGMREPTQTCRELPLHLPVQL